MSSAWAEKKKLRSQWQSTPHINWRLHGLIVESRITPLASHSNCAQSYMKRAVSVCACVCYCARRQMWFVCVHECVYVCIYLCVHIYFHICVCVSRCVHIYPYVHIAYVCVRTCKWPVNNCSTLLPNCSRLHRATWDYSFLGWPTSPTQTHYQGGSCT